MSSPRVISPSLRNTRYLPIERHLQPGGRHKPVEWQVFRSRGLSLCLAIMLSSLVGTMPLTVVPTPAHAQQTCRTIGDFPVCGRFLDEWSHGGSDQANVYVNGLPITSARQEISLIDGKTYDTQWFERAKYEAHPENKTPYDVQLGLLGASLAEGRGIVDPNTHQVRNPSDAAFVGIDKPADTDGTTKVWFLETRHSVSGKILEYWNRYGGLSQFGFPLSEPFQEISETDNKSYTVQYFERNRFELHPEKQAPYEVELGLLGVQQYEMTPVVGNDLPIAPPPGVKSTKDTLTIGVGAEPGTLDGGTDSTANSMGLDDPLLYLYLVNRDAKGNAFGELAWYAPTIENGGAHFVGVGDDRHLQVKFKMRSGMKWSDGVEITSNDVLFSYKIDREPDTPYGNGVDLKLYNVDNPDKYTVLENFYSYAQARDLYATDKQHLNYLKLFVDEKKPVTDVWYDNAIAGLWPEHELSKIPATKFDDLGYFSDPSLMLTSGSFKVERWDHGQQLVLVPNPYYSLTAPPILKKIVYRFIPDTDTQIAQFMSGDVDTVMGAFSPNAQLQQVEKAGMTVEVGPTPAWEHLDFNLDRPYFQDKAVRQAIAYAINRQKIVDTIFLGRWTVLNTMNPPGWWTSVENPDFPVQWKEKFPLHLYPYDPAKANQMLDQAGWVRGPDGIRAKNGVRLSFRYDTTTGPIREIVQPLIQADLRAVGIEAKTAQAPSGAFFDALSTRDFDLAEFTYIDNTPAAGGSQYDSADVPTLENGFNGGNITDYKNPHYDELLRASIAEVGRSEQYPLQAEMQAIFSEDLPSIPLYVRNEIEVHAPNLVNWDPWFDDYPLERAAAMYFK